MSEMKMEHLRFMAFDLRFTPFHRRFTSYEGKSTFVSCSFHLRFMLEAFVSHFTLLCTKCETKPKTFAVCRNHDTAGKTRARPTRGLRNCESIQPAGNAAYHPRPAVLVQPERKNE